MLFLFAELVYKEKDDRMKDSKKGDPDTSPFQPRESQIYFLTQISDFHLSIFSSSAKNATKK